MFKALLLLSASLPLRMVHGIARFYGSCASRFPSRARTTTLLNLQTCFPDASTQDIARLARLSLQHTAMTALEMGKAWLWPLDRTLGMIREIEGQEVLNDAVADARGTLVLAPHLGNWEVFGFYITEQAPTTFMYQPPRNAALDRLIKSARSRGHASLAPTNRQGVAQLLKALKSGEWVGVLPDQEPPPESGVFAPFFGVPALSMTLVAKLVGRTGARVICGFAMRLPHGKGFKLIFHRADPQIYAEDLVTAVTGLNRTVESCVRLAIEQYQWEYKRFKRRPDGSRFYD